MIPPPTIRWTAAGRTGTISGAWNNPSNWTDSAGRHRVPLPRDNVAIDRPGTYAVNLDVDASINAIAALGTASGRQTLLINGHTL